MPFLRRIATATPRFIGSLYALFAALVIVVAWLIWGIAVGFSNSWLLWPSAVASVFTFVIVFSLQYTQNRDTRSIQLKLDEILRASHGARSELMKLELMSDTELARVEEELIALRRQRRR